MTNESSEKNIKKPAEGEAKGQKAAPAKKKLSVVFKPQNSSSMKELPKGLKNALHGGKPAAKDGGSGQQPVKKGPRPLPAGTKPVKPAVFGEVKEERRPQAPRKAAPVAGEQRHGVAAGERRAERAPQTGAAPETREFARSEGTQRPEGRRDAQG